MSAGVVEQVCNGSEIYNNPATAFVASFGGENNPLKGRVSRADNGHAVIDTHFGALRGANRQGLKEGDDAFIFIRPESLQLGDGNGDNTFESHVIKEEFEGNFAHLFLRGETDDKNIKLAITNDGNVPNLNPGDAVKVSYNADLASALPDGELADE